MPLRRRRNGLPGARRRDAYLLDGEKTWISNGGIADVYVVFAARAKRRAKVAKASP